MSRISLIAILCLLSVLPATSNSRWELFATFDGTIDELFETKDYVYFTSRAMPDMGGQRRKCLFRYDKEGDEMQPLTASNLLTTSIVSSIQYCPQKEYVVAVGTNYDVTFIYNDGKIVTMPDYRLASLTHEKTVNGITIDPWHNCVYLSTNYGYIAINDEAYEIKESRVYGEPINSMARVGDYFVIQKDGCLWAARHDASRFNLSDYEKMDISSVSQIVPLSDNEILVFTTNGAPHKITRVWYDGESLKSEIMMSGRYYSKVNNKNGVFVMSDTSVMQIEPGGEVRVVEHPTLSHALPSASYDLTEVWLGKERKGIMSYRAGSDPSAWAVTREFMLPNAPSTFATSQIASHPSRGSIMINYPHDYQFKDYPGEQPLLVSGYKDGWWTNYSPAYTNEERATIMTLPYGLAVDPDNPDYIYIGSESNGIVRLNLADGSDIIHMSKPNDKDNGKPGFVEFVPAYNWSCCFSAPRFDADGNMWTVYCDLVNQTPPRIYLYCWEAADRRASTPSNVALPKRVDYDYNYKASYMQIVEPLKSSRNRNRLVFSSREWVGEIAMIDTKGTPTDSSDDIFSSMSEFNDQWGNKITVNRIRFLWEDPSTGYVWVGHSQGIFYFNPDDFFKGQTPTVNRIKVARNDGTNLADYLLDNVPVNQMTTDSSGRKWFATSGGIVVTSSDGRTIEEQINTSNSPLPSDVVYGMMYIPSTNSMLISTSEGIAEYYLTAEASASGDGDLKIYPNPVRPDYFGYVTIEGLPENSIVKIVDASGNIVKELGPVTGDVQWDVTNHQFRRVSSGVYFVLASAGMNESAFSTVGKIMVVN